MPCLNSLFCFNRATATLIRGTPKKYYDMITLDDFCLFLLIHSYNEGEDQDYMASSINEFCAIATPVRHTNVGFMYHLRILLDSFLSILKVVLVNRISAI